MAVPTVMTDLSTTAASNSPAGSDPIGTTADDFFRAHAAIVRRLQAQGANVASASTVNLGAIADGNYVHITGTTTITAFGTVAAGISRALVFDGALILTHNATSLILLGGANITTAAGDVAEFVSEGSGNWRMTSFIRKSALPALSGANGDITSLTACTALTNAAGIDIKGTNTNDSAAAGDVGEFVDSQVASGSAVSLTTATAANVTSISLTAGDWDVYGSVGFLTAATTNFTQLISGVSVTSATIDTNDNSLRHVTLNTPGTAPGVSATHVLTPTVRISLSGTTTVYMIARASFSISTCSAFGRLSARRVR